MKPVAARTFHNILFATDFSEDSVSAVPLVRQLRHHFDADCYVVHVMDVFPHGLSTQPGAVARTREIREQSERRLQDFVRTHDLAEEQFESALLTGEVSDAIDRFTAEHNIDLIVLGTRGDTGLGRLFRGSTAEEIFRTARCPVMLAGPSLQPKGDGGFQRLLFASDLSPVSRAALPRIESILMEEPQSVIALAHFTGKSGADAYEKHAQRERLEAELRDLLPPALQGRISDVFVEEAAPEEGINDVASRWSADLLILGVRMGGAFLRAATHGRRSITHQVLSRVACPVLTVRAS